MLKLRKFLNRPKRDDTVLSQLFYADSDLCEVAHQLDSFDGRRNPARCAALVAQLRQLQDQVLKLVEVMMLDTIPDRRTPRDFRAKYPDDLTQEGLAGQLWFGAECLAAGSNILNREVESASMRPLAKSVTKQIDYLRSLLREQAKVDCNLYGDCIKQAFVRFDRTFAEFELCYVSAMVPVKTAREYDLIQDITVLFSETVNRALVNDYITKDMIDYYDPALMFTIPRLAIVCGLVIYPDGPLKVPLNVEDLSEMFQPYYQLLVCIRGDLRTLTQQELNRLEKMLCNQEEPILGPIHTRTKSKSRKTQLCNKTRHRHGSSTRHRHGSSPHSLFRGIRDLSITGSANLTNQPTIINDSETGEARAILPALSPTNVSSDPPAGQFVLHLPSGDASRAPVTVVRILENTTTQISDSNSSTSNNGDDCSSKEAGSKEAGSKEAGFKEDTKLYNQNLQKSARRDGTPPEWMNHTINTMSMSVEPQPKTSEAVMRKLFLSISCVADQLQTNRASDLRNILKAVFELVTLSEEDKTEAVERLENHEETTELESQAPPIWMPDAEVSSCTSCHLQFTMIRRRHHCRNCGQIFCGRCSSNRAPLPEYGYPNPVRLCNNCYVYRVIPFYSEIQTDPTAADPPLTNATVESPTASSSA